MLQFTGERIVPQAGNCEPRLAEKMYQEHIARYAFAHGSIAGKRVLDVGCGVGYGSQWLALNGASHVTAFDISPEAIAHANEYYSHPNLDYHIASAIDFDFAESFDVVTCFELIEHVDDQASVLRSIRRALNANGLLFMSTPKALEQKRGRYHTHEFTETEFREFLLSEFPSVRFYFENNHFISMITDHRPEQIDRIHPLFDQYSLDKADYFIAVASATATDDAGLKSDTVAIIGNDRYVLLLENDVRVLKKAEIDHLDKIADLTRALSDDRTTIESLSAELGREREIVQSLISERDKAPASASRVSALETACSDLEDQMTQMVRLFAEREAGIQAENAARRHLLLGGPADVRDPQLVTGFEIVRVQPIERFTARTTDNTWQQIELVFRPPIDLNKALLRAFVWFDGEPGSELGFAFLCRAQGVDPAMPVLDEDNVLEFKRRFEPGLNLFYFDPEDMSLLRGNPNLHSIMAIRFGGAPGSATFSMSLSRITPTGAEDLGSLAQP